VLVEAMAAKPGGLILEPDLIERSGAVCSAEMGQIIAGDFRATSRTRDPVAREPQDRT
jgi:hypothetical protein